MAKKESRKMNRKQMSKKEEKKYNPDEIPLLKSPGETIAGKIAVIVIVGAMFLGPIIALIVHLFTK